MKRICTALLIGAAAIGVAAMAPAAARALSVHEMTILLPSGATETIRYTGDVAPEVSFDAPSAASFDTPFAGIWAPAPSFVGFDRIAAQLDREMNAMWREAQALTSAGMPGISEAALNRLPPGTESYSVITQSNGNNVCRRTTEIIRPENGGKPKTVTHVSGNCAALNQGNPGMGVSGNGAKLTQIHMVEPAVAYR